MAVIVPGGERIREERQMQLDVMRARDDALAASWEATRRAPRTAMATDAFGIADPSRSRRAPAAPIPEYGPAQWTPERWMADHPRETREKAPERPVERETQMEGMDDRMQAVRPAEGAVGRVRMRMR